MLVPSHKILAPALRLAALIAKLAAEVIEITLLTALLTTVCVPGIRVIITSNNVEHQIIFINDLETFTIFIANSYNVTITNVTVIRGRGTGLLVRGVHGHVYLSVGTNAFIMNNTNLYVNFDENVNGIRLSGDTTYYI